VNTYYVNNKKTCNIEGNHWWYDRVSYNDEIMTMTNNGASLKCMISRKQHPIIKMNEWNWNASWCFQNECTILLKSNQSTIFQQPERTMALKKMKKVLWMPRTLWMKMVNKKQRWLWSCLSQANNAVIKINKHWIVSRSST